MSNETKILPDHEILSNVISALKMDGGTFAEKLGYKNKQSIYNITNKTYGRPIPTKMRAEIMKKFPVNWRYLDYGIEPVLLSPEEAINQRNFLGLGDSKGTAHIITPGPSEIESMKADILDLKAENRSIKAAIRDLEEALRQLRK